MSKQQQTINTGLGATPSNPPMPESAATARDTDARWPGDWGQKQDVAEMQKVATDYFQRLTDSATAVSEQARSLYQNSEVYVREHPASSLLGAVGVGLLIGFFSGKE